MLKLRFSKPTVKLYNDNKITVCTYKCTLLDRETKVIEAEFTVTGTAKCNPEDKVNMDFGRKLADSRAKLEAYKIASRFIMPECYRCMIEEVNEKLDIIAFIDSMNYLKAKEVDHINYIKSELEG